MKIDVSWLSDDQFRALEMLTYSHNRQLGDNKSPEQMLRSMLFCRIRQLVR